ncbi:MAG TPA: hypothetical protein VF017_00510 [Thermoanaerobaculia bacterium]|nr:hypothetical protein [Thermoanaerobaculia bacterium]
MTILAAIEPVSAASLSQPSSEPTGRLSRAPRLLSLAGLEWLLEAGLLSPGFGSPLEPFSGPVRVTTPAQRQRAASGFGMDPVPVSPEATQHPVFRASWLGRALSVLESPEARVRVATATPDRPAVVLTFYLRDGFAVLGQVDQEGFYVDRPLPVIELAERLAKGASNLALPAQMTALCVLPEVYELACVLWHRRGKSLTEPITRGELESLLEPGPGRAEAARELLGVLLEVGLLEASRARFHVSESYRSWLELVWSGHILEIERTPLAGSSEAEATPERALFAGPADRRVLCEDIVAPAGEPLVLLSRLGQGEIRDRLARLLAPRPASPVPAVATPSAAGMEVAAVAPRDNDVN